MSYRFFLTQIKDSFKKAMPICHNMIYLSDDSSVIIFELSDNNESKFYLNIHKNGKSANHVFDLQNKRNIERIKKYFPYDNYDNFIKYLNILFLMQS